MKKTCLLIALFLCLLRTAQISAAPKSDVNFGYIESQRQPFTMKEGKNLSAWVREGDRAPAPAHAEDNALIALMYLEHYEKTGDQASLKKGKEALDFLMAVEKERGIFASSWPESSSEGTGVEVRADLPSAYSFWALARGLRIIAGHDPTYGRILSSHIEGAVTMLKSVKESRPAENLTSIQGLELQGLLVGGRSDITSLYVLGLLEYYEAGQNGDVKGLVHHFCNGIKSFSSSSYEEFPFGGFYQNLDHFTCWTLPHSRQISALALAGKKFTDKSWTGAAEREANGLYAHFLASYGPMCGMAPAPVIYPQEPAGAETMTSNLMNLYRVTGKEQYAHMAGLTASWFNGNNEKKEILFDRATGKAFSSLGVNGKSSHGSAAASAHALMAFMEVMDSQAQEYAASQWKTSPHTFQLLEAEDGKAVRKDYDLEETIYPGGTQGRYVVIKRENSFWIKFDITRENEYDFYLVYLRQTGFDMGTSIMMRVDGDKIFPVPLGGAPDSPYMYMKDVLDTRVLLPGPHSLGIRFSGLLHSKAAIVDSVLLQPVVEWRVMTDDQGGPVIFAKSFQKNDRDVHLDSFGIPNLHATSARVYTVNGTLSTQRKDDLASSSSIRIPGYGYAMIRGK